MSDKQLCIHYAQVSPGGERLDRFLAGHGELAAFGLSRARWQRAIRDGMILVDDRVCSPRHSLRGGELICIDTGQLSAAETPPPAPLPEAIALDILFEDDDLIVVNKPVGLVVHPGAGNLGGTLVNALLHHCDGKLATLGGRVDVERPGIVHRLDRDTSGCLVAAKTDPAQRSLVEQFAARHTTKIYRCVVAGRPVDPDGRIETRIARHPVHRQRMANTEGSAGKTAVTDYITVHGADDASWTHIECRLHTGRTHQIRVHMKESLRCPILGDPIYGKPARDPVKTGRLMLHAWQLGIHHPKTREAMSFEAPLPAEFERFS